MTLSAAGKTGGPVQSPSSDPVHICLSHFSQLTSHCPAEKNGLARFVAILSKLRVATYQRCETCHSSCQVSHCLAAMFDLNMTLSVDYLQGQLKAHNMCLFCK